MAMDCEKFDPLLLDALDEELDEVTSAAVKRHAAGCARCGPILDGMRSTRRRAHLPLRELPADLDNRILSSVTEAEKAVPLFGASRGSCAVAADDEAPSRAARALSWAGSWAMRPQTAMAAVFLLMIGTSAFVIRSRHSSERPAAVSVTEQGMPAGQSTPVDNHESLDSKAAAAAHGAHAPTTVSPPPPSPAATGAGAGGLALGDPSSNGSAGPLDGLTGGKGRVSSSSDALGSALAFEGSKDKAATKEEAAAAEKKSASRASTRDIANAAPPAGAPRDDDAPYGQAVAPPASKAQMPDQQDGFSAGMAAYRARSFAEATRHFDTAARSGDQNAALWAAKSVKQGNGGLNPSLPRFEAVAQRSSGTWVGSEALLEAARCQIALGQLDPARDKLTRLTRVPSHAAPAQQALNELAQVASRREAERRKSGTAARPAAAPRVPSKPAATAPSNVGD